MADHEVRLSTKGLAVKGIDLSFDVKIDGKVLGTLLVSEGGLDWRPKHARRRNPIQIGWAEFAHWAEGEDD
ncbi:hypothetical protein IU436_29510 [Nocardia farcinica]|uniref:hypothetical protein n=1 Tax=Nocardia TaxID=1817 RepID=UPI001893EF0D|nr:MULTISPECIES: hypothetical protein [Nocardia]MBF6216416.1 hypothetical protein [Nocardia puris]MBF6422990.1 hypothetical protein [Nocardia farcinica]MBF6434460.1 hypothetical protein [Nocardia farcinica]MBF6505545.1 hypothetical protein [Nocardia farcinica]